MSVWTTVCSTGVQPARNCARCTSRGVRYRKKKSSSLSWRAAAGSWSASSRTVTRRQPDSGTTRKLMSGCFWFRDQRCCELRLAMNSLTGNCVPVIPASCPHTAGIGSSQLRLRRQPSGWRCTGRLRELPRVCRSDNDLGHGFLRASPSNCSRRRIRCRRWHDGCMWRQFCSRASLIFRNRFADQYQHAQRFAVGIADGGRWRHCGHVDCRCR